MVNANSLVRASATALGTLICVIVSGVAGAQSIVKWVDAQGQTHYSDHAPTGQGAEPVTVHVSRPSPAAVSAANSNLAAIRKNAAPAPTGAKDSAAAREAEEEQRRLERQEAADAAKAQADKDLIARCNQAHEIYCNQGADTIRQRQTTQAEIQYADAITARQERISRGQRPGTMPPPPP